MGNPAARRILSVLRWLRRPAPAPVVMLRAGDPLYAELDAIKARQAACELWQAAQETRTRRLFEIMGEAAQAAGLPSPDLDDTCPLPRLSVVPRHGQASLRAVPFLAGTLIAERLDKHGGDRVNVVVGQRG